MHTLAPTDVPWYNHHYSQRPLSSSDRLPHLNLPQSYAAHSSYGATTSRIGLPEVPPSGNYSSIHGPLSSQNSAQQGSGLGTPSPSPTEQTVQAPNPIGLPADPAAEQADFSSQQQNISSYSQIGEPYSGAMNQQTQYMDSHQSYSSAGQSYASQPTTSQYPQYPHQPAVLQPGPGNYAPSPTYNQQYAYSNGVTSPPGSGHSVPPPMGSQISSGMLPLPGKLILSLFSLFPVMFS